jgi:ketosteroid isomerase-like protein
MLKPLFVSSLLLAASTFGAVADPKQDAQKLIDGYTVAIAQKSAVEIAALYTKDGVLVNSAGVHTDIAKFYEGPFKNGLEKQEAKLGNVWPLNDGTVLTEGETTFFFGKTDTSEPRMVPSRWTAVLIKEGDQMKIKLLTGIPMPTPSKEASGDKK